MTPRALYLVNGSISSMRVRIALHDKGLAFEPRRLRVMREPRDTRSPAFLALNPRGQAPVLVEPDGVTIHESLAILTYLELRYPEPSLLPRAPAAMARALAFAQESEATALAYEPLEQLFAGDVSDDQRRAIAGALADLDRELALWEPRAAAAPFIAGDTPTLADCAFHPVLTYLLRRGLSLAAHPALAGYHARFAARPSAIAAQPEGWQPGVVGKPDLFARARALA